MIVVIFLIVLLVGTILFRSSYCLSTHVLAHRKNFFTGECKTFGNDCAVPWYYIKNEECKQLLIQEDLDEMKAKRESRALE
jgi:hypothetical protein